MIAILNHNGHCTEFIYMFNCRSNNKVFPCSAVFCFFEIGKILKIICRNSVLREFKSTLGAIPVISEKNMQIIMKKNQ
jgi:hypothetical protein